MNKFVLSLKAKTDLIKIAKYTKITWGLSQRNDYIKVWMLTPHSRKTNAQLSGKI